MTNTQQCPCDCGGMCVLNADLDAAEAKVEQLKQALEQAIAERTPHDCGILKEEAQEMRKQRDEALAEVEDRKDALIYAAKQIHELKNQRDLWLHRARQENEKHLNLSAEVDRLNEQLEQAIAERTPHDYGILKEEAQEMRNQRDEARAEVERLKHHIPDATKMIRPEPSRLELAALLMIRRVEPALHRAVEMSFEEADALIAAAKEEK
jgi:hypothetical protein